MKVNKLRFGVLGQKLYEANLAFKDVGGGFFICNKDRNGNLNEGLYTASEVKHYFENNDKVLIQVRNEMNKFGEYILSPITNFDATSQ